MGTVASFPDLHFFPGYPKAIHVTEKKKTKLVDVSLDAQAFVPTQFRSQALIIGLGTSCPESWVRLVGISALASGGTECLL